MTPKSSFAQAENDHSGATVLNCHETTENNNSLNVMNKNRENQDDYPLLGFDENLKPVSFIAEPEIIIDDAVIVEDLLNDMFESVTISLDDINYRSKYDETVNYDMVDVMPAKKSRANKTSRVM